MLGGCAQQEWSSGVGGIGQRPCSWGARRGSRPATSVPAQPLPPPPWSADRGPFLPGLHGPLDTWAAPLAAGLQSSQSPHRCPRGKKGLQDAQGRAVPSLASSFSTSESFRDLQQVKGSPSHQGQCLPTILWPRGEELGLGHPGLDGASPAISQCGALGGQPVRLYWAG